jgi:hypothetical protein
MTIRVISLLSVFLSFSIVSAQEAKKDNPPQEQAKIPPALAKAYAELERMRSNAPTTLAEAHAALERMLSPEELAKIDAMPSEDGMIMYRMSLGLTIRNGWGLWAGSPLAKHMEELGFVVPDDMSGVILETFWCKRHGQDFRLKERAAEYKKYWDAALKAREEEKDRAEKAKVAIRNMMMGLRFEKRDVPVVQMPDRTGRSLSAFFLSSFRGGVFIATYRYARLGERDTFVTPGYYFDPADRKIHKIRVPEVNDIHSSVVAGPRAWFAGKTDGKAVLLGVNGPDRMTLPLPQEGEPPQLGLDGQSLLAVYPKTIFRLTDQKWTLVYSGDIRLPHSGPPPRVYGNMVFLRDEGMNANLKRLSWLTLGEQPRLSSLDHDVGVVGESGPQWETSSSYCVTSSGDLWVCVGDHHAASLLRRSKDGSYSIAIMNNSVRFTGELLGSREPDQGLAVSGVATLPDDTLLLVGNGGLYRLKGNELVQELAFANTREKVSPDKGIHVSRWHWDPSNVLVLDEQSYFISGTFGGIYLLRKGNDNQWSFLSLDEERGDPVVW